jgi:hypothetical protein
MATTFCIDAVPKLGARLRESGQMEGVPLYMCILMPWKNPTLQVIESGGRMAA